MTYHDTNHSIDVVRRYRCRWHGCGAGSGQTDLFGRLLNTLGHPAATIPPAGSPPTHGTPSVTIEPTPAQTDNIRRKLNDAGTTPTIRQGLATAMPILEATVSTMACATDAVAFRRLNARSIEPHNYTGVADTLSLTPIGRMRYHDRSTCVDLYRVVEVSKPALNELVLRLSFLSASSGETSGQTVPFRKTADGWLLDGIAQ